MPSTASRRPCSARATLTTTAPPPVAASRYRPSGVSVSPSSGPTPTVPAGAVVTCTGIVATLTGASDEPVRSTSMDPPSATKAHRPSGVTATPNGLPETGTIAVRDPAEQR